MNEPTYTLNLVRRYFNICNIALARRRENIIGATIQTIVNHFESGKVITLKVVDTPKEPGVPEGYYTTQYIDGHFTPATESEHHPGARFTLRQSFLEDVIDNADDYIAHPEKLDWSWLQNRR